MRLRAAAGHGHTEAPGAVTPPTGAPSPRQRGRPGASGHPSVSRPCRGGLDTGWHSHRGCPLLFVTRPQNEKAAQCRANRGPQGIRDQALHVLALGQAGASGGAVAPRARAYSLLRGGVVVGHEAEAVQHGRQLLPLLDRESAQLVRPAWDKQPLWPLACPAPADTWPTRTATGCGGPMPTPLPYSPSRTSGHFP